MAKKTPKEEFKPGQLIIVKLSNGRIEEARVNHVIQHPDGMKLQVDFGHDETALIELEVLGSIYFGVTSLAALLATTSRIPVRFLTASSIASRDP